jgi:hypothetical protein
LKFQHSSIIKSQTPLSAVMFQNSDSGACEGCYC